MKKFIILGFALLLAGCTSFSLPSFNTPNPVSRTRLAQLESGYGIALSGAVAYRSACAQRVITNCKANVEKLQVTDKAVQVALDNANKFMRDHPTLDASAYLDGVSKAVAIFQATAKETGAVK